MRRPLVRRMMGYAMGEHNMEGPGITELD